MLLGSENMPNIKELELNQEAEYMLCILFLLCSLDFGE